MAHLGFDATQVQPDSGQLDPIPAGWYNVMVDESDLKPTSDGMGARLAVRFTVIDGQFANRKIYTGFNVRNSNPVAQEIAFKQLSALAHAVGVLQVQDSQQLHGIPLKVRVKIRPPKDGYDAQNDITAYKNINEDVGNSGAGAPAAPAAPGAPAAPAGFGTAAPPAAPAAPAAAPGAGWGGAPAQPWQQPAAAAAPAASAPPPFTPPAAPAAPAAPDFPPAGWTAHPTSPGYFYQGQEVLSEADLRAKMAPAAPAAPAAPPAPPAAPAAPAAAPAAAAPAGPDPAAQAQVAVPPWQQKPQG